MFYFLSKTIDFLMMPLCIGIFFIVLALYAKSKFRQKLYTMLGLGILVLISNSYFCNIAFNALEFRPKNISSFSGTYDVGVVLTGGMINWSTLKSDHIGIGQHGDRIVQSFLLYKNHKIGKILISGASPKALADNGRGEGKEAKKLLIAWGVPESDIILEERARNTRENAVFTNKMVSKKFSNQRIILITSSFHMKRALACFQKVGLKVDTYPADFYGGAYQLKWDFLIPEPNAIASFNLVWREWFGFFVYKVMGYC